MKYLIGIDLGTSGTKTVLFDELGKAVASSTVEYPLYQPENGWAEQDPADWWNACTKTLQSVLADSKVSAKDIAGIGFSGQMHGLVMLDENGEVLRRSIIWCDGRTADECAEINKLVGVTRLVEITANAALTSFTAGNILWVRNNEPDIYKRCRYILLPKDYLRYKLTGKIGAEVADASGMNLLDINTRSWSGEVLSKLDIDPKLLPDVCESADLAGKITAEAAAATGLVEGTPVVYGAGDNAAAAVGTGVVDDGKAFITLGTSGVLYAHSNKVSIDTTGRVNSFCAAVPGANAVFGCSLAAGMSLQWLRNNFFLPEMKAAEGLGQDPYNIMTAQAERIPIGANRLIFLPYLMGERSPLLDPNARGVFFGLSAIHSKYDMLRAVLEGVVYAQRQILDVLSDMGVTFSEIYATGGGGSSPVWRQMIADVLQLPVVTIQNREGPALGAAILAGVGTGLYKSVSDACKNIIKTNPAQMPIKENSVRYKGYYELYSELYPTMKGSFSKLAGL
ncbi:MAG: xylulokinase [Oscillospiraceae bacterium]|nr:xylulokinase [Oscillospiraceae bacterium]MCL2278628.1 xylulokinase [Oscillospiraceae bacterium]